MSQNIVKSGIQSYEQKFAKLLEENYHYPAASIKVEQIVNDKRIDIGVIKGNKIIQAFEIKVGYTEEQVNKESTKQIMDSISTVRYGIPFYVVSFDRNSENWTLYEREQWKYVIADKNKILNYEEALQRFFGIVEDATKLNLSGLCYSCYGLAALMLLYFGTYLLLDCYRIDLPAMLSPLSTPFIMYIITIACLILLPQFVKLFKYIKKLKLSFFEIELKDNLTNSMQS